MLATGAKYAIWQATQVASLECFPAASDQFPCDSDLYIFVAAKSQKNHEVKPVINGN
jgi:hypothetical protein